MKNKSYFQAMLLEMVQPLVSFYSKGSARLELGVTAAAYGNNIAGMEGFSRVLWGMVPYWAGGGKEELLLARYQQGLSNGTNPESDEFWGYFDDRDQRMVEMAAISFGRSQTYRFAQAAFWNHYQEHGILAAAEY